MDIDSKTIALGAAFVLSAIISFLSGRILWGTLIPLCCLVTYLLMMSFHATGWKFGPELSLPTAFAVAALLLVGGPMVIISFYGALLGSTLSKRSPKPLSPSLAAIGYLGWGALAGALSLWILPQHFIRTPWLGIANLFLTPLLVGFMMAKLEALRRNCQQELIHLDSFAYGFCFAFGMALVRHIWAK